MVAYANGMIMRNGTISVDTVAMGNQVFKARLVPETPIQQKRTLVPDGVVTDVDSTIWTFELSALESRKSGGLAAALDAAAGTEVDIVLQPRAGTGQDSATFVVIAVPVTYGGEQGDWRQFEVTLPVVGAPTFDPLTD